MHRARVAASIDVHEGRVEGVTLADGGVVRAERVVIAAGAFAESLASPPRAPSSH